MTSLPWADPALSDGLAQFRRSGESQTLEYKQEMPGQVRDLAKEIAAFATSNDGLILLGVADDGMLVGLAGMADQIERDGLAKRIAGVCRDIKPPVRPALLWAVEDEKIILGIKVSKGREPLYYVEGRPYIRHVSVARPAEPSEVIDAVRSYLSAHVTGDAGSVETGYFSSLANVLVGTLRWGDTEAEMRSLKPWVDEWMLFARQSAAVLRDLAAEDLSAEKDLVGRLEQMASLLDEVAEFRHVLGGGDFDSVTTNAHDAAWILMTELIWPVALNEATRRDVQQAIMKMARKLTDLWKRAEKDPFGGQVEGGQQDSGVMGRKLMEFSYHQLGFLRKDDLQALCEIGRDLVALEAERLYMDGGQSQQRVITNGQSCASALVDLTTRYQS